MLLILRVWKSVENLFAVDGDSNESEVKAESDLAPVSKHKFYASSSRSIRYLLGK